MSGTTDTIVAEAMRLPPDQRLTVAHRILSSVEPAVTSETAATWDLEIRGRVARYDAGGVECIPATEVFVEVDDRILE